MYIHVTYQSVTHQYPVHCSPLPLPAFPGKKKSIRIVLLRPLFFSLHIQISAEYVQRTKKRQHSSNWNLEYALLLGCCSKIRICIWNSSLICGIIFGEKRTIKLDNWASGAEKRFIISCVNNSCPGDDNFHWARGSRAREECSKCFFSLFSLHDTATMRWRCNSNRFYCLSASYTDWVSIVQFAFLNENSNACVMHFGAHFSYPPIHAVATVCHTADDCE